MENGGYIDVDTTSGQKALLLETGLSPISIGRNKQPLCNIYRIIGMFSFFIWICSNITYIEYFLSENTTSCAV